MSPPRARRPERYLPPSDVAKERGEDVADKAWPLLAAAAAQLIARDQHETVFRVELPDGTAFAVTVARICEIRKK